MKEIHQAACGWSFATVRLSASKVAKYRTAARLREKYGGGSLTRTCSTALTDAGLEIITPT